MVVIDVADFTRNVTSVFDAALTDDVIVNGGGGMRYRILPISNDVEEKKSPFEDIPYITADITTSEIVDLIRDCRAGV